MHNSRFTLFILLLATLPTHAEIYKHVDVHGEITYTDRPVKGAKKLDLGPMPSTTPTLTDKAARTPSSRNASSPGNFPRVDSNTQNQRDSVRRRVLSDELRTEEQGLADAVSSKKESEGLRPGEKVGSPSYIIRMEKLNRAIQLHRDNINALRKELSTVK